MEDGLVKEDDKKEEMWEDREKEKKGEKKEKEGEKEKKEEQLEEKENAVTDVHLSSDEDIDCVPAISQDWNRDQEIDGE